MINLKQGDCLELMKEIPDKSVDLILADLPYGTTASKWDKNIDATDLWKQYRRIITNQGAIVLFSSGRFTNKLINSQESLYRYKWIWIKSHVGNFVNAKNRPLTKYEELCVFSKGITANTKYTERKMNYFPQGLIKKEKAYRKPGGNKFGSIAGKRKSQRNYYKAAYTNYPTEILNYKCVNNPIHPNQKPVSLLEYLIKTYTKENDIVLDNCLGSGSTGAAAINLNRNFIGYELDQKYFEIAKERLNNVLDNNKATE